MIKEEPEKERKVIRIDVNKIDDEELDVDKEEMPVDEEMLSNSKDKISDTP